MKKFLLSIILIFIFVSVLINYWLTTPCEMDREYSMKRVLKHLKRDRLDPRYLREDKEHDQPCALSYIYKSETVNIHFMVIEGHKVTWVDINEHGTLNK